MSVHYGLFEHFSYFFTSHAVPKVFFGGIREE
jgi:hypothetical protein